MDITVLDVLGTLLSLIGAISSIWFIIDRLSLFVKISWRRVVSGARNISDQMFQHKFDPSIIIGIGRGGAIVGSLISGALGHRPLFAIDTQYSWENGSRVDSIAVNLAFTKEQLSRVLIVSGDVHTGNTMIMYRNVLKSLGAGEIRSATLVKVGNGSAKIDYVAINSAWDRKLPWYGPKYRRNNFPSSNIEPTAG